MKEIVGVILAAGHGTRMAPFTTSYPKPILPICNKPLLTYQIETMRENGIHDIYIVIGYLGYEIACALGDGSKLGVNITYVEQTEILGIAHALSLLESSIQAPFILFLGDIFFSFNQEKFREVVNRFRNVEAGSFLVAKEESDQAAIKKNFAIMLEGDSERVVRVIEKPRFIRNNLKGCGLYLFDLPIFDAIRSTPRTAMRDEYEITQAIQILIDDKEPVYVSKVVEADVNLTFPIDLFRCNMLELQNRKIDRLIDPSAQVSASACLEQTIVGPRARIGDGVKMRNCVVFEDAKIQESGDWITDKIILPDRVIDCQKIVLS